MYPGKKEKMEMEVCRVTQSIAAVLRFCDDDSKRAVEKRVRERKELRESVCKYAYFLCM